MGTTVTENMRQSAVVMRNEVLKFVNGKRMTLFLGLLGLILFVLTFAPYIVGDGLPDDPSQIAYSYLSMSTFVVLIASTLFASISIVSEFEERTALIVFTRPIRKSAIFIGKMLACLVVSFAFIALYYVFAALVSLVVAGGVDPDLFASMGMAFAYSFGTTGVALLVSSVMKRSNTSTILTFVVLLVILPAVSMVLAASDIDCWYMLDQAGNTITTVSEGYRDITNEVMDSMMSALANPMNFINPEALAAALQAAGMSQEAFVSVLTAPGVWFMAAFDSSSMMVQAPDAVRSIAVMAVWGVAAMVASFLLFDRREF